jgi:hypothetical protein
MFWSLEETGASDRAPGSLQSSFAEAATDASDEAEDLLLPDPLPLPEIPELPSPIDPDDAPSPTPQPEDGPSDTLVALPLPDDRPLLVGLNPSVSVVGARTRAPRRAPRVDFEETFAKADSRGANARAADYVRAQLGLGQGGGRDPFRTLARTDLLVVDGSFDKIGRVLAALKLPYIQVTPSALAQPGAPDLDQHKVIFWNCGEPLPARQAQMVARRIRTFVKEGGYLFTTDWGIASVLEEAFPGYVTSSGARAPMQEMVVRIEPAPGQGRHPLLEGVFQAGSDGRWWLEQASFDLIVRKPQDVTVLIESPDLEQLFGRSPAVAATFAFEKGRVLHVLGHYYQEAGNLAGTISAHRLALNFVLMRLRGDGAPAR